VKPPDESSSSRNYNQCAYCNRNKRRRRDLRKPSDEIPEAANGECHDTRYRHGVRQMLEVPERTMPDTAVVAAIQAINGEHRDGNHGKRDGGENVVTKVRHGVTGGIRYDRHDDESDRERHNGGYKVGYHNDPASLVASAGLQGNVTGNARGEIANRRDKRWRARLARIPAGCLRDRSERIVPDGTGDSPRHLGWP
jgi:hypothetical protein